MYDMDGTFGIYWNGEPIDASKAVYPRIKSNGSLSIPGSKMYSVLCKYFAKEVEERYNELRGSILTTENTRQTFETFFAKINEAAYIADAEKWGGTNQYEWSKTSRYNMYTFTEEQLKRLDAFFYNFAK